MNKYQLQITEENFTIKKDGELFCEGGFLPSFGSYSFSFTILDEVKYVMKSSGMFFWRKNCLYKNDSLVEEYSVNKAKESNIKLNFVPNYQAENCLVKWSIDSINNEIQIICLVILGYINYQHKITTGSVPAA
ncbi:hypothetical protein [Alkalimarinus coralli]|uniref:hypothetical protein n=1 Tax=Alkalimarinus coralli TaxID=2935863 RepID=UPI00202B90BB|nr:hypothetical protein [Alkalimarinus coralli]